MYQVPVLSKLIKGILIKYLSPVANYFLFCILLNFLKAFSKKDNVKDLVALTLKWHIYLLKISVMLIKDNVHV